MILCAYIVREKYEPRLLGGQDSLCTKMHISFSSKPIATAFTHRSRRFLHADAAQTMDRPSRDQNRRFGPTGLILPSLEHIPWTPAGSVRIAPVKGRTRSVEEHEMRKAVIATQPSGAADYPALENSCARLRVRRLALDLVVPDILTFLKALPVGNQHQILGLSHGSSSSDDCVNPSSSKPIGRAP